MDSESKKYPKSCNLHLHLGGSFPDSFLRSQAEKYNKIGEFTEFFNIRHQMEKDIAGKRKPEVDLFDGQFAFVSSLVQTPEDLRTGLLELVEESSVEYLEIRTGAKQLKNGRTIYSSEDYLQTFTDSLREANTLHSIKKTYGLLSVDRTRHDLKEAKKIVDFAARNARSANATIVGIDIAGLPFTQNRSIQGQDLRELLDYIKENDLAMTIHFAEAPHEVEKQDTDVVLSFLEDWQKSDPFNPFPFDGKLRLGHVIHLSEQDLTRMRKLRYPPIEICPYGHKFWIDRPLESDHVITEYYNHSDLVLNRVVLGTDDDCIFGTSFAKEVQSFEGILKILQEKENKDTLPLKDSILKCHAKFGFATEK